MVPVILQQLWAIETCLEMLSEPELKLWASLLSEPVEHPSAVRDYLRARCYREPGFVARMAMDCSRYRFCQTERPTEDELSELGPHLGLILALLWGMGETLGAGWEPVWTLWRESTKPWRDALSRWAEAAGR